MIEKIVKIIKQLATLFTSLITAVSLLFIPVKSESKSNNYSNMPDDIKYVFEYGDEIIRCIKEKDRISLSNLFCEKVRNTDYLNKQIEFFFDYIDEHGGVIINDGIWEQNGGHHRSYRSGKKVVDFLDLIMIKIL